MLRSVVSGSGSGKRNVTRVTTFLLLGILSGIGIRALRRYLLRSGLAVGRSEEADVSQWRRTGSAGRSDTGRNSVTPATTGKAEALDSEVGPTPDSHGQAASSGTRTAIAPDWRARRSVSVSSSSVRNEAEGVGRAPQPIAPLRRGGSVAPTVAPPDAARAIDAWGRDDSAAAPAASGRGGQGTDSAAADDPTERGESAPEDLVGRGESAPDEARRTDRDAGAGPVGVAEVSSMLSPLSPRHPTVVRGRPQRTIRAWGGSPRTSVRTSCRTSDQCRHQPGDPAWTPVPTKAPKTARSLSGRRATPGLTRPVRPGTRWRMPASPVLLWARRRPPGVTPRSVRP